MVAGSRWTSYPSVVVDCPVCGRPLPRVVVEVETRSDGSGFAGLVVAVPELLGPWWDVAQSEHPDCGVIVARRRYAEEQRRRGRAR